MKIDISKFQAIVKKISLADRGQSMTEYALMGALVAFGATAGYRNLASEIANAFNTLSSDLATSLNPGSGGKGGDPGSGGPPGGGPPGGGPPGGHPPGGGGPPGGHHF